VSAPDRRLLVERDNGVVSIRRQCELLGMARSGLYRSDDNDLVLMRRIDEQFTTRPFLGSRRMTTLLHGSDGGVAPRHDWPVRPSGCGHVGQRKSVAHMPTASATIANLRHGRMIEAETETAEISN
jgi:putative transposase